MPRARRAKQRLPGHRPGGAAPLPLTAHLERPSEAPQVGGRGPRSGGVMSVTVAAARLGPAALTTALEALPEAVTVFDAAWTVCYINPAGGALVGRPPADLIGRILWDALPEVAGSVFHSFLLHARGVGGPVTWRGFFPPA